MSGSKQQWNTKMRIKNLTVAQDERSGDECLYIDGKVWCLVGETTVHASDIDEAAGGCAIMLSVIVIDAPEVWPDTLTQLKEQQDDRIK